MRRGHPMVSLPERTAPPDGRAIPPNPSFGDAARLYLSLLRSLPSRLAVRRDIRTIERFLLGPDSEVSELLLHRGPDMPAARGDFLRLKQRIYETVGLSAAKAAISRAREIYDLARAELWIEPADQPDLRRLPLWNLHSPKRKRDEQTLERALNDLDVSALWRTASGDDRMMVLLEFGTSLRQQEARALRRRDIVLRDASQSGYLAIVAAFDQDGVLDDTKTEHGERQVPFGAELYVQFRALLGSNGDPGAFVLQKGGTFLSAEEIRKRFAALMIAAGVTREEPDPSHPGRVRTVPKCAYSMMRRTGASLMARGGLDETEIQAIMGHTRPGLGLNYYAYDLDRLNRLPATVLLGPANRAPARFAHLRFPRSRGTVPHRISE